MAEPKQIHLVWTGEYSDASVVAACSTLEAAEAIVKWLKEHDSEGKEKPEDYDGWGWYPCESSARIQDPGLPGQNGRHPYRVEFDGAGNITKITRTTPTAGYGWMTAMVHGPYGNSRDVVVSVVARDEKHAVKIAADLRAQAIAAVRP